MPLSTRRGKQRRERVSSQAWVTLSESAGEQETERDDTVRKDADILR